MVQVYISTKSRDLASICDEVATLQRSFPLGNRIIADESLLVWDDVEVTPTTATRNRMLLVVLPLPSYTVA